MLRTDNFANCNAKKLRTAKNELIWLAKKCCELLCERFALLGIRSKKNLQTALRFSVRNIGQNVANH